MVTGITSQCHFSDSIVLKRILKVLGCRETMHEGKGSTYSNNESTVPELILVFGSQPAGDVSYKPGGRRHYFPPGLQLPPQPFRGLLPVLLLGKQRHNRCKQ